MNAKNEIKLRSLNELIRADDYSPKDLMVGSGIGKQLYNQWLYRNIFTATHEADGPGTTSSFSFHDILVVSLIVRLRWADIRLKKASRIAHDLAIILGNWRADHCNMSYPLAYIVFNERKVSIEIDSDKDAEMSIKLDVNAIVNTICARIEEKE